MVKRRLRLKAERAGKAGKRDGGGDAGAGAADGPLPKPAEHLQRKVLRRVRFLEKVAAARPRPALAPSGGVRKKKRRRPPHGRAAQLPDLSTLAASLADTAHDLERRKAAPRKGLGVGGAKARSRIVTAETRRLQQVERRSVPPGAQVLAHPQFAADPIAAVSNHLAATLPPAPAPAAAPADPARRKQQKQAAKQRRRERRAAGMVEG